MESIVISFSCAEFSLGWDGAVLGVGVCYCRTRMVYMCDGVDVTGLCVCVYVCVAEHPASSFDLVLSGLVPPPVFLHPSDLLEEVARILKPSGSVCLAEPVVAAEENSKYIWELTRGGKCVLKISV